MGEKIYRIVVIALLLAILIVAVQLKQLVKQPPKDGARFQAPAPGYYVLDTQT